LAECITHFDSSYMPGNSNHRILTRRSHRIALSGVLMRKYVL